MPVEQAEPAEKLECMQHWRRRNWSGRRAPQYRRQLGGWACDETEVGQMCLRLVLAFLAVHVHIARRQELLQCIVGERAVFRPFLERISQIRIESVHRLPAGGDEARAQLLRRNRLLPERLAVASFCRGKGCTAVDEHVG